ncbi:hypothetical protein JKP88DRAFT_240805 [Tribonema minus]|uniref:Uncharacterized protein n=1 Tax=Tribonema minus TaxID=303371 RepID=A0A835ZEV8_9STRA|nr:hypothetical protein JKP88DRAFT_240805 [Tribonema minus]
MAGIGTGGHIMIASKDKDYLPPQSVVDITVVDIGEPVLRAVAFGLKETGFLADADPRETGFSLHGVVRGPWWRPFVIATVTNECIQPPVSKRVVFIINTTVPLTYLSNSTLDALEDERAPKAMGVNVHGTRITAYRAPAGKRFGDANVLGTTFVRDSRLTVVMDFAKLSVELHLQPPQT